MDKNTQQTIRRITSGLTGRRESDIVLLQQQIEAYSFDRQIRTVLERMLSCLMVPEMHPAMMIA